ncbi:MAG: alpha/beta fold hydrolase [Crocinitomix sp.]|nr:alpha/beta fold hydrolase [Crocinitomix sp.]
MKPNLILLHGALGSKLYFKALKELLKINFNVFDLDFEGHGEREMEEEEFSIPLFSDNLMEFLFEQGIEKTHVFGYSMGGYVALDTATEIPEMIDKIVTYGTKFNWSPAIAAKEVKMLNPAVIEEKLPEFVARLVELHPANDWKVNMIMTANLMQELGQNYGFDDAMLKTIENHVTLGWGTADKMVTELESKNVSEQLPNGSFHSLEGQPHPIENVNLNVLVNYIESSIFKA